MWHSLVSGLSVLVTYHAFIGIALGTLIGWVFAAIPGLQTITALVVILPLSFFWDATFSMYVFAGIIGASGQGGSIPAIVLNMPGTVQNAATTFEGFPLTRKGKAIWALAVSSSASFWGSVIGLVALVALIFVAYPFLLAFGPADTFWMMVLGIIALSVTVPGNLIKVLLSVGIGVIMSAVGFGGPAIGVPRFTFGSQYLMNGLNLVAIVIGLLVVSEVFFDLAHPKAHTTSEGTRVHQVGTESLHMWAQNVFSGIKQPFLHLSDLIRSSMLGTVIGAIPGVGGSVAQFLSYNAAVTASKNPETFGTGRVEGLIASDSAINAKDGGTLLPTLLLGIPGNGEMALLLAAWTIHGLTPGPFFLQHHAVLAWALILGVFMSNALASLLNLGTSFYTSRIPNINAQYMLPAIAVISLLSIFAVNQNFWDMTLILVIGVLGFFMKQFGFSVIGTVIGFILGGILERNFYTAIESGLGNYGIFFQSTISKVLVVATLAVIVWYVRSLVLKRRASSGTSLQT